MIIVLTIYLAALGCWLGGIVFFSFFTAPAVFTVLPRPEAGQLISTIFPRYYMLGYIVGTISLVLAIYFTAVRGPRIWWGGTTVALAIALGITFYAGTVILPRADALRTVNEDPNPDPSKKRSSTSCITVGDSQRHRAAVEPRRYRRHCGSVDSAWLSIIVTKRS